jgi:hypothetical protein
MTCWMTAACDEVTDYLIPIGLWDTSPFYLGCVSSIFNVWPWGWLDESRRLGWMKAGGLCFGLAYG